MKLTAIITSIFLVGFFMGNAIATDTGAAKRQDAPVEERRGRMDGIGSPERRPGAAPGWFQEDRIPGMHRAEILIGENVLDLTRNPIGRIDDLVISQDGRVTFIIMSHGGVLGIGADRVAVPWEAANLRFGPGDHLMTDITEQQLAGAPTFEDYAQFHQEYEQQVHGYFGSEPKTEREFQPGIQQPGRQPQRQPGRMNRQPSKVN